MKIMFLHTELRDPISNMSLRGLHKSPRSTRMRVKMRGLYSKR